MVLQALLAGNGLLLAVLIYLAKEMRADVKDTREKVLVMWNWFENYAPRRTGEVQ